MRSERLRYHPVEPGNLDAFHSLVQDEHVRRYMMDGNVFPREWSEQRIRESQALFERRGVGIWLAYEKSTNEVVGFCGFWTSPGCPDPQLIYAMFERFRGRGFATEMARASIAQARQPGFAEIVADVDEINTPRCAFSASSGSSELQSTRARSETCSYFGSRRVSESPAGAGDKDVHGHASDTMAMRPGVRRLRPRGRARVRAPRRPASAAGGTRPT